FILLCLILLLIVALSFVLSLSPLLRIFFLVMWPPLVSALFPYTTLFRSHRRRYQGRHAGTGQGPLERTACHQERAPVGTDQGGRDRKSTRLNSSHVKISYAVFCLKKKKKQQQQKKILKRYF